MLSPLHGLPAARSLLALVLLALLAPAPLARQGKVLTGTKISDLVGGFGAELDDQDQFGRSIAYLGDLNRDGVGDIAVGAQGDDDGPGGLDRGAVYILFLKANGTVDSYRKLAEGAHQLTGLDPGDQFGRSLATLGDLDNDGIPELAVGANFDDDGGTHRGAVYVLFLDDEETIKGYGKISDLAGNFTADLQNFDEFGRALAPLGDLDGDGVEDLAVSAPYDDDGDLNAGAVYILFLGPLGGVKRYQKISQLAGGFGGSLRAGDFFGHALANIGDFDGDGVVDLAVGAVLDDDGGYNRGAVWILLLQRDGTVKREMKISQLHGDAGLELDDIDQFGVSVAGLGDLDRDGVPDLAVGAVKDDDGGEGPDADLGAIYILFPRADGTVRHLQKVSPTTGGLPFAINTGDWFGSSLAGVAGTRLPVQLAVGARYDDDGGGNRGAVYLLQLDPSGAGPPAVDFTGSALVGPAPLTVGFRDTSTGYASTWVWDFESPPGSELREPEHTFRLPGTYDVRCLARGVLGSDERVKEDLVTVVEPPAATAFFTSGRRRGYAPHTVVFADRSTGPVHAWAWDLGNGTTSALRHPTHVYTTPGTYSVSLTVTAADGERTWTEAGLVEVLAPHVVDLRDGVDAYAATSDTEVGEVAPGEPRGTATTFGWSGAPGERSYALLRFEELLGDGPGQLPATARLRSATLELEVVTPGDEGRLHEAAIDWDAQATWEAFGERPGVQRDELGLYRTTVPGEAGRQTVDVTDSVRDWLADPATARGWIVVPTGREAVALVASEDADPDRRPRLVLEYELPLASTTLDPKTFPLPHGDLEEAAPGLVPPAPWWPLGNADALVQPSLGEADHAFPTHGKQWLEVSAAGTENALPPSSLGGRTRPAEGGAGAALVFRYPQGWSTLALEAAFLLGGTPASLDANDWMSVDVSDGQKTVNLWYADSFAAFPHLSQLSGLPMTDGVAVDVDLRELFPRSTPSTLFTLTVQVGSGGVATLASRGYVDHVRLEEGTFLHPYDGCGDPDGSLTLAGGGPVLGTSAVFALDLPGTPPAPSAPTWLFVSGEPDTGDRLDLPCDGPRNGADRDLGDALQLARPGTAWTVPGPTWSPGAPAEIALPLPALPELAGQRLRVQGFFQVGAEVLATDALELVLERDARPPVRHRPLPR